MAGSEKIFESLRSVKGAALIILILGGLSWALFRNEPGDWTAPSTLGALVCLLVAIILSIFSFLQKLLAETYKDTLASKDRHYEEIIARYASLVSTSTETNTALNQSMADTQTPTDVVGEGYKTKASSTSSGV